MIRLPAKTHFGFRRTWRRRVSNPLAAFAAIMLFASTQISLPENASVTSAEEAVAVDPGSALQVAANRAQVEDALDGESEGVPSQAPHAAGGSGEPRGVNLNLFLLRR